MVEPVMQLAKPLSEDRWKLEEEKGEVMRKANFAMWVEMHLKQLRSVC